MRDGAPRAGCNHRSSQMFPSLVPATAAFALSALALCPAASADCTKEVADAVLKQSQQKSFRMESNVISEQGPLKMTVDYILPDRMRQVAVTVVPSSSRTSARKRL